MKVFVAALVLISCACAYGTPIAENVEEIAPMFDAARDVRILLQTRNNRNNPQQIQFLNLASVTNSHFNRARQTRVLVHGWLEDDGSDISTATSAELLNLHDFNVLFIDWSVGSRTINYVGAANRVEGVGSVIAQQIDFLHQHGLINFNQLTIVGFSLGAHIAGHAGKNVRRGRVNSIIGLDPAGPLFSERRPAGRIDAGDANYVEIVHTNGPTVVLVGAGIGSPIGHTDFWPNGGSSQPGCLTNTCSHGRAVDYYGESLRTHSFHSLRCPSRGDASSRRCNVAPGEWMGGDLVQGGKPGRGCFYLDTNRSAPFARGPRR